MSADTVERSWDGLLPVDEARAILRREAESPQLTEAQRAELRQQADEFTDEQLYQLTLQIRDVAQTLYDYARRHPDVVRQHTRKRRDRRLAKASL